VDNSNNTGIKLKVNGVSQGTQLQVSLNKVTAPTQGQGEVQLSGGGQVKYYDVKVSGNANGGTSSTVCITDPTVNASSQMAYWNGKSWVVLASTVNGDQICGDVPLADLGYTNFAVGTGFVAAVSTSSSTTSSQGGGIPEFPMELSAVFFFTLELSAVFFFTLVILVFYFAARKREFDEQGSLAR